MAERRELTEHEELALAIGRVAMQSAVNDDYLRLVLDDLIISDSAFVLFEGQSTTWLCETLPIILYQEDPYCRMWARELHEDVKSAVKQIYQLNNCRNIVVHSTWTKGVDPSEADITEPRPAWSSRDDAQSWSARRSRHRTYAPPSEWTVSDVHLLADMMKEAGLAVRRAYRAMKEARRS